MPAPALLLRASLRAATLLLACGSAWPQPTPQALRIEGQDGWLRDDQPLVLHLAPDLRARAAQLRFVLGHSDVTALVDPAPASAAGALDRPLRLVPRATRWPAGESELVMYDGDDWTERARLPMKVLTRGGFESSTWTPQLDLRADGRPHVQGQAAALADGRSRREGLHGQAGLGWSGQRAGWQFEAAAHLAGSSDPAKALRAAERADQAPRVDLADYRVALAHDGRRIELGHLAGRAHPLLVQDPARRGLALHSALGPTADISLHVLSGTALVGWDHLLGVTEAEHRAQLLSAGVELLPARPGGLRAELGVLDAAVLPRRDFNAGSVPDAERSQGLSLSLAGQTAGERVRGSLALARSRFVNPFDPALALDGELRAVQPATRNAAAADLQLALLASAEGAVRPYRLRLDLHHERAAPLYRSLMAAVTPDQSLSRWGLHGQWAGATAQWQWRRRLDNLDHVATLLRTRTDEQQATLNLPVASWRAEAAPRAWWPGLTLDWQQVHQFAVNLPRTEDSGFAASQRPDQMNRTLQLRLDWTRPWGQWAYALNRARQDNRQPGREAADFATLGHVFSASRAFGETLRVNVELSRQRQLNAEQAQVQRTRALTLHVDWTPDERWTLGGGLALQRAADSLQRSRTRHEDWFVLAARRFAIPQIDKPLPAQWQLRLAGQADRQDDRTFGLTSDVRGWWLDVGLSIGFY